MATGDIYIPTELNTWVNLRMTKSMAKERRYIRMGNFSRVFFKKEKKKLVIIDSKMGLGTMVRLGKIRDTDLEKYFYRMEIGTKESGLKIKEKERENRRRVIMCTQEIFLMTANMVMDLLQKTGIKNKLSTPVVL